MKVDESKFLDWLQITHNYKLRSARNVMSRLRRINRLLGDVEFDDHIDALYALEKCNGFSQLTETVRFQLRRAIRLLFQFRKK